MTEKCNCWLKGIIEGDGFTDDRHVEIYNSSKSILRHTVVSLRVLVQKTKIKVDIYSGHPKRQMISKWSDILNLPFENFKLRDNTSPWKSRTEKIRIRISSKMIVDKLGSEPIHPCPYLRGLFDAEGSVDIKGYIEFKQLAGNKGKKLVQSVYQMLKDMGIKTTKPRIKNDRNIKKDVYIYVKDIISFKEKIGFVDSYKRTKLTNLIKIKQLNKIPEIEEIKKLIKEKKNLWEIMTELKSPYHRVRLALKENHLSVRQTR